MIQHSGPISGIAAYRDRFVATAGYDSQVILWDQASGRALNRVWHDHLANQCSFSGDGTRLVTSSSDYTARLWSVPGLQLLSLFNDQDDDVEMSVFHPAGDLVATASRDHKLRVYDLDGHLVKRFIGHSADVISVEWTPSGDQLITSSDDGTVKRWSLETGKTVQDIDLGGVETDTITVGRDGVIYAGNDDGEIVVVRGGEGTAIPAHASGIKRLALNADANLLVSLSYDRVMRLWDLSGHAPARLAEAALLDDVWPRSCAFAAGSSLVFSTFGARYRTYDYGLGKWLREEVPPTRGINAVSAHKGSIFTVGDAGVVVRDGVTRTPMGSLCNFFTALSSLIVTGGQLGKLMDAADGRTIHQHRSPLNCGARFIRDGSEHLIVGSYTGEGLVFRLDDRGQLVHLTNLDLHDNAVKGVAVSGKLIFSVCADRSVAWHDTETLRPMHRIAAGHDRIANACTGLGGGNFASVGRDLKLRLWTPDYACTTVDTPHTNSIKCIAANETGELIATGSYHGHVHIYSRAIGGWVSFSRPTTAGISSLCYEPVRRKFLASSYDGDVYEIPETQE
jgi:toxoflavin biosynthesis protein ToxC